MLLGYYMYVLEHVYITYCESLTDGFKQSTTPYVRVTQKNRP